MREFENDVLVSGDGCVEKPLATLWRNYTQSSRPDVSMQLTVGSGGLKATTRDHGLTEYWAHRLTMCSAPAQFPRLFCWVYRHEGRRLRHELRCHAVLCSTSALARQIETHLKNCLALALAEFKRDKISRQNARLSLVNSVYDNPTMPRRKIMLSTGGHNYKPPLERSKSAPKLTSIEENLEEEEEEHFEGRPRVLRHSDSAGALLDKRKSLLLRLNETIVPVPETPEETLLDEKSELILAELAQNALKNDLIESCEQSWFNTRNATPDLIPSDGDEGSLSSGCESASTVSNEEKAEFDFKVGGCVTAQLRKYRISGVDSSEISSLKYCPPGLGLDNEEVSLVPVGETQSDFSSLRVYKKRACEAKAELEGEGSEEENGSACSDESGYEEATDSLSSISNVILV